MRYGSSEHGYPLSSMVVSSHLYLSAGKVAITVLPICGFQQTRPSPHGWSDALGVIGNRKIILSPKIALHYTTNVPFCQVFSAYFQHSFDKIC
jgi:hypothetical protein